MVFNLFLQGRFGAYKKGLHCLHRNANDPGCLLIAQSFVKAEVQCQLLSYRQFRVKAVTEVAAEVENIEEYPFRHGNTVVFEYLGTRYVEDLDEAVEKCRAGMDLAEVRSRRPWRPTGAMPRCARSALTVSSSWTSTATAWISFPYVGLSR